MSNEKVLRRKQEKYNRKRNEVKSATIQEEVHRFAIGYHRKKQRSKIGSSLTKIDGIGETRAKALLRHFGTIDNIRRVEIDDILRVKGMNITTAKAVFDYFHQK